MYNIKRGIAISSLALLCALPVYSQTAVSQSLEQKASFDDTLQYLERSKSTLHIGQPVDYLVGFWNRIKSMTKHSHISEKDLLWEPADGETDATKLAKFTKEFFPAYLAIIDEAKEEMNNGDMDARMEAAETLGRMKDPRDETVTLHDVGGFDTVQCTIGKGYFTQVSQGDHQIEYTRSRAVVCVTPADGKLYRLIQPIDGSLAGEGFSIGEEAVAQSTTDNISFADAMNVDAIADVRLIGRNGVLIRGITASIDMKSHPTDKYLPEDPLNYHADNRWKSARNWILNDLQEKPDGMTEKRLGIKSTIPDASSRTPGKNP